MGKVTVVESKEYMNYQAGEKAWRFFLNAGLEPVELYNEVWVGEGCSHTKAGAFTMYHKGPDIPHKLFGLIPLPARQTSTRVADLRYDDARGNHKNLVLDVYGKENLSLFTTLAEKLAELLQADVHISLRPTQSS